MKPTPEQTADRLLFQKSVVYQAMNDYYVYCPFCGLETGLNIDNLCGGNYTCDCGLNVFLDLSYTDFEEKRGFFEIISRQEV